MLPLTLATEDELSEAVAYRLLRDFPSLPVGTSLRRNGNGYLRSRIDKFREIANSGPVLVITDLDTHPCPAALVSRWLGRRGKPEQLLLRVAVREIEAWLLADHDAMAALLGKHMTSRLPEDPDTVLDPKQHLLTLAQRAPRDIRLDLRAEAGTVVFQGLGYNARLCDLVRTVWQPAKAERRSASLRRALARIRELAGARHP